MDLATRKSMRFYRKDGTLNVKSKNLVWANPLMPTNAIEMRIRTVFLIYSSTYIFCFGIFAAGHYLGAKTRGHLCAGSGGTNPCQVSFLLRNSTLFFAGPWIRGLRHSGLGLRLGIYLQCGDNDDHWLWSSSPNWKLLYNWTSYLPSGYCQSISECNTDRASDCTIPPSSPCGPAVFLFQSSSRNKKY